MRTVSPTFALVGDMKSLGPLGAAGKKEEETKSERHDHPTEHGEQILLDTCFVTGGKGQIQFPVN